MTRRVTDPVAGLAADDTCWCGTGEPYGRCHGDLEPSSRPGDPLPPDPPDALYLTPTNLVTRQALRSAVSGMKDAPMYAPSPTPAQRPIVLHSSLTRVASEPPRVPSLPFSANAAMRYELLDAFGLTEPERLRGRLQSLSQAEMDELRYGILDLGKAAVDRLLEHARLSSPPTVLWVAEGQVASVVGRTMLWADHYLTDDGLGETLLTEDRDIDRLEAAVREDLGIKPLATTGIVVPVLTQLAKLAVIDAAWRETEVDLRNHDLVARVKDSIVVEGPSARQAIFLRIRDEDEQAAMRFYLYGQVEAGSLDDGPKTLSSRMLGPYDPTFDYSEWIDQSKRQTAAELIQDININLAIGYTFGGHYVARTPFRARVLEWRNRATQSPESALVWADIPVLGDAAAPALAAVAQEDEAVEALRAAVRSGFRGMGKPLRERKPVGLPGSWRWTWAQRMVS